MIERIPSDACYAVENLYRLKCGIVIADIAGNLAATEDYLGDMAEIQELVCLGAVGTYIP